MKTFKDAIWDKNISLFGTNKDGVYMKGFYSNEPVDIDTVPLNYAVLKATSHSEDTVKNENDEIVKSHVILDVDAVINSNREEASEPKWFYMIVNKDDVFNELQVPYSTSKFKLIQEPSIWVE